MADTNLEKMLDAVINDNSEQAEQHFHDFVAKKVKELIQGDNQETVEVVDSNKKDNE